MAAVMPSHPSHSSHGARPPMSARERAARDGLLPSMLDGARRGDEFAFQVLYEWSVQGLAAYVALRSRRDLRNALLRDVYRSAWERIPRFHEEAPAAFELWLVRLFEEYRGGEDARRDGVDEALDSLPAVLRETLALRDVFGRSVEQAAHALGEAPDQVRLWHREALASLASAA